VHFVGLAFKPFKKTPYAVPLRAPIARPVVAAFPEPALLFVGEFLIRSVGADAALGGVGEHFLLALPEGVRGPRLDGAFFKRLRRVRNDERRIHRDDAAEAAALLTGAYGGVEAEKRRGGVREGTVAVSAEKSFFIWSEQP